MAKDKSLVLSQKGLKKLFNIRTHNFKYNSMYLQKYKSNSSTAFR